MVGFFAAAEDLAANFARRYPQALRFDSTARILDDPNIALVVSAGVNAERAPLGTLSQVLGSGGKRVSSRPFLERGWASGLDLEVGENRG